MSRLAKNGQGAAAKIELFNHLVEGEEMPPLTWAEFTFEPSRCIDPHRNGPSKDRAAEARNEIPVFSFITSSARGARAIPGW